MGASPRRGSPGSRWSTSRGVRSIAMPATRAAPRGPDRPLPLGVRRGAVRPPQPRRSPRPQAVEHPGGRGGQVKLLDFGIAKLLGNEGTLTETALHPLTPEYASPEQLRGSPSRSRATSTRSASCSASCSPASGRIGCRAPAARARHAILDGSPAPASERAPPRVGAGCAATSTPSCSRAPKGAGAPLPDRRAACGRPPPAPRRPAGHARGGIPGRIARGSSSADIGSACSRAPSRCSLCALGAALAGWRGVQEAAKEREVRRFLVRLFGSPSRESRGSDISARELLDRGTQRPDTALAGQPEVLSELLSVLGQIHLELGLFPVPIPCSAGRSSWRDVTGVRKTWSWPTASRASPLR